MTSIDKIIETLVSDRTVKELRPARSILMEAKAALRRTHPDAGGDDATFIEAHKRYEWAKGLDPDSEVLIAHPLRSEPKPEPAPEPPTLHLIGHSSVYPNTYEVLTCTDVHRLAIVKLGDGFRASIAARAKEENLLADDSMQIQVVFANGRETERFTYNEATRTK